MLTKMLLTILAIVCATDHFQLLLAPRFFTSSPNFPNQFQFSTILHMGSNNQLVPVVFDQLNCDSYIPTITAAISAVYSCTAADTTCTISSTIDYMSLDYMYYLGSGFKTTDIMSISGTQFSYTFNGLTNIYQSYIGASDILEGYIDLEFKSYSDPNGFIKMLTSNSQMLPAMTIDFTGLPSIPSIMSTNKAMIVFGTDTLTPVANYQLVWIESACTRSWCLYSGDIKSGSNIIQEAVYIASLSFSSPRIRITHGIIIK